MKRIISVVGPTAAGKDTAANYIAGKLGIPMYVTGDLLKQIAAEEGNLNPNREELIKLATRLAQQDGAYIVKVAYQKIAEAGIIAGIRQVDQVEYLRDNSKLTLIAVDADVKIRFERAKARGKFGDAESLDEFIRMEQWENSGNNSQRTRDCMALADYTITNNSSLQALYNKLDCILTKEGLEARKQ